MLQMCLAARRPCLRWPRHSQGLICLAEQQRGEYWLLLQCCSFQGPTQQAVVPFILLSTFERGLRPQQALLTPLTTTPPSVLLLHQLSMLLVQLYLD